jgi:hypothetical protein
MSMGLESSWTVDVSSQQYAGQHDICSVDAHTTRPPYEGLDWLRMELISPSVTFCPPMLYVWFQ